MKPNERDVLLKHLKASASIRFCPECLADSLIGRIAQQSFIGQPLGLPIVDR